jgi:hypothetical protein
MNIQNSKDDKETTNNNIRENYNLPSQNTANAWTLAHQIIKKF